jgi:hypothetical protein
MSAKSRERIYGSSIRASAERAKSVRKEADRLACEAWNMRMLGYKGPAQPSPTISDPLNAGSLYLEVRCLGCDTHQAVALDIVRRAKTDAAARKLVEIANGVEAVQDGRIYVERVNEPFLAAGGSADQFRAGIERAIALGWIWRHESGTYVKFTDSGAALFA